MKFLTRAEKIDEERDAEVGAGAKEGQMLRQLMGCFQKVVPFVFVKNRGLLRIDCRSRGSCDVSVCVVCVCVCVCWTRGLWMIVQHLIHRFATASSSSGNIHYLVEPQGTGWRKQTWIEGGRRNTITQTWTKWEKTRQRKLKGKKRMKKKQKRRKTQEQKDSQGDGAREWLSPQFTWFLSCLQLIISAKGIKDEMNSGIQECVCVWSKERSMFVCVCVCSHKPLCPKVALIEFVQACTCRWICACWRCYTPEWLLFSLLCLSSFFFWTTNPLVKLFWLCYNRNLRGHMTDCIPINYWICLFVQGKH